MYQVLKKLSNIKLTCPELRAVWNSEQSGISDFTILGIRDYDVRIPEYKGCLKPKSDQIPDFK